MSLKFWSEFFELNDGKSEVNIVEIEDQSFWFQFSHLAKLLGYSNPTVAMKTHCEDYEIQKFDIGQHELVNFVSESGFYSLILGSQKPIAKKFKKRICSEVLSKPRASGVASLPSDTSETIQIDVKEWEQQKLEARRQGYLSAANDLYDPIILTDPKQYVLRICHVVANGFLQYQRLNYRRSDSNYKYPSYKLLVFCSKFDVDDFALGAISINEFFEILTIFSHAGFIASFGKLYVELIPRTKRVKPIDWRSIAEGESDEILLAAMDKINMNTAQMLNGRRSWLMLPDRLKTEDV